MASVQPLDDEQLQKIYTWVDQIPLSRPKRNITRDFSDAVLFAEVIHHYFPKMVELHNYSNSSSVRQKLYNWSTLNAKVLKRLKFQITKDEMEDVVNCVPGVVEVMLMRLQSKMAEHRQRKAARRTASASGSSRGAASTGGSARGPSEYAPHAGGDAMDAGSSAPYSNGHSHSHSGGGGAPHPDMIAAVADKDTTIQELSETVEFLELKVAKLEQLLRLKDSRIHTLTARLQSTQLAPEQ